MTTKLFNLIPTTYKISDFLTWNKNNKLILSPDFQRRLVWNDNARSYLIDTIIRWLPVPLLIIRDNKVSLEDYEPKREIVDWQQRLNTIFDFIINKGFKLKKNHNEEFWNMLFTDLPETIQQRILNYKFSIYELPSTITDSEVLEIFSRLNSTWYKLNKQELRNAEYDWEFKTSIYSISNKYINNFINWNLFNVNDISRMKEAEFTTDLYIYMIEWLRERKPVLFDNYYKKYDKTFPNSNQIEVKYSYILNSINNLLWEDIENTLFKKESLFYHLFILFHEYFYWKEIWNNILINNNVPKNWRNKILKLSEDIENDKIPTEIIKAFSYWTNNIDSRKKKYKFINEYIYD